MMVLMAKIGTERRTIHIQSKKAESLLILLFICRRLNQLLQAKKWMQL